MPTAYMLMWSITIIIAVGFWRLRNGIHLLGVILVSGLILFLANALFRQLAWAAGVDPSALVTAPSAYLVHGPLVWLALLVMPCGWLGPVVGLNFVEKWTTLRASWPEQVD